MCSYIHTPFSHMGSSQQPNSPKCSFEPPIAIKGMVQSILSMEKLFWLLPACVCLCTLSYMWAASYWMYRTTVVMWQFTAILLLLLRWSAPLLAATDMGCAAGQSSKRQTQNWLVSCIVNNSLWHLIAHSCWIHSCCINRLTVLTTVQDYEPDCCIYMLLLQHTL